MAVVAFPNIEPQGFSHELRPNVAQARSPFTQARWVVERGGAHFGLRFSYRNLSGQDRAVIKSAIDAMRGGVNAAYVRVPGYVRRGSGIGTELFTNGDFSSGTTGWSAGSATNLTAADYLLRAAASIVDGTDVNVNQAATVTIGEVYALRGILHDGRGSSGLTGGVLLRDSGANVASDLDTVRGLRVAVGSPAATGSATHRLQAITDASGFLVGDYVTFSLASLVRCAQVDDGPNLLTQSDAFDDADWTKTRSSISSTAEVAPDGTATAEMIAEDGTAASTHFVTQAGITVSSAAADYAFACYLKADNRTWALLQVNEDAGPHGLRAWFNLSAGTVGSVTTTGANWDNEQSFIVDAGNGWYLCVVVGRKVSASTSLDVFVTVAEADNDVTFDGLSQDSIVAWRATLAASSVPSRPSQTTTAATTGTAQTGGALYLKGLPVSTDGILLVDDIVQIPGIDQVVRATAPLNADAAGLGYFQFEPPLRASPADGATVIDVDPLVRVILDEGASRINERPGGFLDADLALAEDIVPA